MDINNIHAGDEVCWTDPDGEICSRNIVVQHIDVEEGSDIITIYGVDGDYLQCFAHELS